MEVERAVRDTVQTMMAPFRFTAQWAIFPLLAALAVVLGASLGGLDAWLATHPSAANPWLRDVVLSSLPIIVAIALLGLVTNSWTIATLTGMLAATGAFAAHELAESRWATTYVVDVQDLIVGASLALIGGGALGLGACTWHHESGLTQAIGASLLGGAIAWSGWQELAPDGWPRDTDHLVGWVSLALVVLVIVRCAQLGPIVFALAGTIVVAWLTSLLADGERFDLGSTFENLRHDLTHLLDRLRDAIRR